MYGNKFQGSAYNAAALPNNRVGNQKFLKVFRDIASDIRKGGAEVYFSLELKFDILVEDGEIPANRLQQTFKENEIYLKNYTFLTENSTVLEENHSGLWIITDEKNGQIFATHSIKDRLYVYVGTYPKILELRCRCGSYCADSATRQKMGTH